MATTQQEERIAALLMALGPQVTGSVVAALPQDTAARVRALLDHFQHEPLDDTALADVLDEFLRFFHFAVQTDGLTRDGDALADEAGAGNEPTSRAKEAEKATTVNPFVPTGDVYLDLKQLQPCQIAGALAGESPRTIAVVLDCLSTSQAGVTLQLLPEQMRAAVFLMLRDPPKTPAVVLERIVRTTVQKGCQLDASAMADPDNEANRRLAELLRAMDQTQRGEMLAALETHDPEIVPRIKKLLYSFEDLLRISNRSVQRILGEIDTASLAIALRGADPQVVDKIMGNLSKRARVTLTEEIELLGYVKAEDEQAARRAVCDIISRLDESGDLEME